MGNTNYRKDVRKYFLGNKLPTVLIVIGVLITLPSLIALIMREGNIIVLLIGLAALIGGIFLLISNRVEGEKATNDAMAVEISNLKQRAMDKLNVISEQINSVEPVVIHGQGQEPNASLFLTAKLKSGGSILAWLLIWPIKLIVAIISLFKPKTDLDPINATKLGMDGEIKYMLLQLTMFAFTDSQLLMYTGNVDLSTGRIYDESTIEMFYSDISAFETSEVLVKYFDKRQKRFVYKSREFIHICSNGANYSANFTSNVGKSRIDDEFAGMRSLIREKKLAMK